jgi:hypothetical protein
MVAITFPDNTTLEADLANTHMKRIKGLSGRKEKINLLFSFPFSMKWSFWMPNMKYPISIIYLNKEKEVVDVLAAEPMTKDPKTWKSYKPQKACKYVLETPFEHNIKIGDKLQF